MWRRRNWFSRPSKLEHHPGRKTFGASVYAARKGGTIITCASTSGYMHQYDNRYLWMNLKSIVGSHFANYRESWETNRPIAKGMIHPTLSRACPLVWTPARVFVSSCSRARILSSTSPTLT